jgi:hypothetical protein
MKDDSGGMGMKKHGRSGRAPKSPKLRHAMKCEAEKDERKAKPSNCKFSSVSEAINDLTAKR